MTKKGVSLIKQEVPGAGKAWIRSEDRDTSHIKMFLWRVVGVAALKECKFSMNSKVLLCSLPSLNMHYCLIKICLLVSLWYVSLSITYLFGTSNMNNLRTELFFFYSHFVPPSLPSTSGHHLAVIRQNFLSIYSSIFKKRVGKLYNSFLIWIMCEIVHYFMLQLDKAYYCFCVVVSSWLSIWITSLWPEHSALILLVCCCPNLPALSSTSLGLVFAPTLPSSAGENEITKLLA